MSNLTHDLALRYQRRLLAYCRQLTRDENQALDLSQKLWLRVIRYRVDLGSLTDDKFARLAVIARNLFRDGLKRNRPAVPLTPEEEPGVPDSAQFIETQDLLRWLYNLIDTLPVVEKAVVLVRLRGCAFTWDKVATNLAIPVHTAKKRYRRAVRRLRARVAREWR